MVLWCLESVWWFATLDMIDVVHVGHVTLAQTQTQR